MSTGSHFHKVTMRVDHGGVSIYELVDRRRVEKNGRQMGRREIRVSGHGNTQRNLSQAARSYRNNEYGPIKTKYIAVCQNATLFHLLLCEYK